MNNFDIQTLGAIVLLSGALIYAYIRFQKNWKQGDADPKCENCDIPEMKKKQKELEN